MAPVETLLHRAHRGERREPGAGDRRLAGAGGRALLPGHRPPAHGPGPPPPLRHPRPHPARHRGRAVRRRPRLGLAPDGRDDREAITGQGALFTALETARTGRLGDIVATIQGEQDEIIRAPLPGVLVVQGGPGHRQDRRGPAPGRLPALHPPVPARGPGRAGGRPQPAVPRLHRAGAALARRGRGGAGGAGRPGRRRPGAGRDRGLAARVKGDPRMVELLARAVRDRERPAAHATCVVGYGLQHARLHRRAQRAHRGRGPSALPPPQRRPPLRRGRGVRRRWPCRARRPRHRRGARAPAPRRPRCARRSSGCGRCSPPPSCSTTSSAARALLDLAAAPTLRSDDEWRSLYRPRADHVDDVAWTTDDVPAARRGPGPARPHAAGAGARASRRRRDPHLRPHRGRRGPGPLARCSCGCSTVAPSTAR